MRSDPCAAVHRSLHSRAGHGDRCTTASGSERSGDATHQVGRVTEVLGRVGECEGRVTHAALNKDTGLIDPDTGEATDPAKPPACSGTTSHELWRERSR